MTQDAKAAAEGKDRRRFSYYVPQAEPLVQPTARRPLRPTDYLDMSGPSLAPDCTRILVSCLPKSGSTFLATAIACLPGMRRANITPMPTRRREQELDLLRLLQEEEITRRLRAPHTEPTPPRRRWPFSRSSRPQACTAPPADVRGWVAQHHVRFTLATRHIIADYEIVPVVLVRNIFDALISLRDHLRNDAVYMSMAYFSEDMRAWPDDRMADFLVDMVAPWYINFFVSWQELPQRIQLTYERVRSDASGCIDEILSHTRFAVTSTDIDAAVSRALEQPIRLNKGVTGRGAAFDAHHRERIARYASYYPHIDFGPLGL